MRGGSKQKRGMRITWSHKKEEEEELLPGSGGKPFFVTFEEAGLLSGMATSMEQMLMFGKSAQKVDSSGLWAQMHSGTFISNPMKTIRIELMDTVQADDIAEKKKKLLLLDIEINKNSYEQGVTKIPTNIIRELVSGISPDNR
jgi:hypothetical protein